MSRTDEEIDKLVTDNMPLAIYFAGKYSENLGRDVALSAAMDGLWSAAKKYDQSKGNSGSIKFGTIASMYIKWNLERARLPMLRKKRGGGVLNISLDEEDPETGKSLLDKLVVEETGVSNSSIPELKLPISNFIKNLTTKERSILIWRFGLNGSAAKTLDDVARVFGLTRERIRQIEFSALKKLRRAIDGAASLMVSNNQNPSTNCFDKMANIKTLITGYRCIVCKRHHHKSGKAFIEHFSENQKHYGWEYSVE